MSGAYTSDGRRRSSMTHAKRGHDCAICPERVYGNGGVVSHGRAHVRRGEAVELVKHYPYEISPWRAFFPVGDPRIDEMIAKGAERVEA
jgi:hypothetical protein